MILYVNGDGHSAAAEAATPYRSARDDSQYFYLGSAPHPANLAVSWARRLADILKMGLNCQAQAGQTNDQIMRATREHVLRPDAGRGQYFVIIQWSTADLHQEIWDLHRELQHSRIQHVFFNGVTEFIQIEQQKDWGNNYMSPYSAESTFSKGLERQGFQTVAPDSVYFGPDAHAAWARSMLQYCVSNKLVT